MRYDFWISFFTFHPFYPESILGKEKEKTVSSTSKITPQILGHEENTNQNPAPQPRYWLTHTA